MVRKGYKTITVKDDLFERVKKRAEALGVSIPDFIAVCLDVPVPVVIAVYHGVPVQVKKVEAKRLGTVKKVLPVACRGCERTHIPSCHIWQVQFRPFGEKCPRET